MKIFLSAVSTEFESCRKAVASDLRAVGAEVVVQEDFQQQGRTLLEKLESYIAGCDRMIALVGAAYGWEPKLDTLPPGTPRRSYTQWEYFFAQGGRLDGSRQPAKEIFVYFASQDFLHQNQVSQADEAVELQQKFISRIHDSGKDYRVFSSPQELRHFVLRDYVPIALNKQTPPKLPNHAGRIQNFFDEYLGTPASPVPFGGRGKVLKALDDWLTDRMAPPYSIIVAEAGRGKSALLVRWTKSIRERDLARVIFVPVSIRFNTALSSVVFPALAAELAEIFGEHPIRADLSAEQWRSVCLDYMRQPPPDGKALLVILDGLDEAADWRAGPDLFPASPPSGLRALVSARYAAGDMDERGWLRRLGWDHPSRARNIPLRPLTRRGVSDVLAAMGDPLGQLTTQVDVVSALFRLSQGDPLVVRLYVEALLPYGQQAVALRPEDLPSIRKGLAGYFARWWDDQSRRAESSGRAAPAENQDARDFFNVCATALGPLFRNDVAEIVRGSLADGLRQRHIAGEVDRFIIGDGRERGYVFSHPRLGQFFWDEMTESERSKWEARFMEYGRQTFDALDKGRIAPGEASSYIVQYYGAHLERTSAPAKDLYALVTAGWLRAWEALEGASAGFLNDTERAWSRAESALPPVAGEDIAAMIKCALCRSSVITLSANVPPELLSMCVQHGVLTPLQALTLARQIPDHGKRSEALVRLAPVLPAALTEDAFAAVQEIKEEPGRATALIALLPRLAEELKAEATRAALTATQAIKYEPDRTAALTSLSPHLSGDLLPTALTVAREIEDLRLQALTLTTLASFLQEPMRASIEQEALEVSWKIKNEKSRTDVLIELAPNLLGDLKEEAVQKAFAMAQELPEWDLFTSPRAATLTALAPFLPDGLKMEALQTARAVEKKEAQAKALTGLAPYLPEAWRPNVLREALDAARAIKEKDARGIAFTDLAPHLPEEQKPKILREALGAVRAMEDVETGPGALAGLAPYLPEELLKEALAAAQAKDGWGREVILVSLAPRLPEDLRKEALQLAQAIEEPGSRGSALAGLSAHSPEPLKGQALNQALVAARAIADKHSRGRVLVAIAPHIPDSLLSEVLAVAQDKDARASVEILIDLAKHLPDKMRAEATKQALLAARSIRDEVERVRVLVALAQYLTSKEQMLREVLEAAQTTGDGQEQVRALTALIPYLPNDLKTQVLTETLARAQELPESGFFKSPRAAALTALAPQLPETMRTVAWEAAQAIKDTTARASALTGLARPMRKGGKEEHAQEALEAAQAIGDDQQRAFALMLIVPDLPKRQRAEIVDKALEAARASTYALTLASVMKSLAPYMSEQSLSGLLSRTTPRFDNELLVEVLNDMAPHLRGKLLSQAQTLAQSIKDDDYRAAAVAGLSPFSPDTEAMHGALDILLMNHRLEWTRAMTLAGLAPHLPEGLKKKAIHEALAATPAIQEGSREEVLDKLAPQLPEWARAHPESAYFVWKELLREFSALPRPTFLKYLRTLLPLALALAGEGDEKTAAAGIFRAIQEVGMLWP